MNELCERVFEATLQVKLGILAGSLVLVVGVFYFLLIGPTYEEMASLDTTINGANGLRAKISARKGMAANLEQYIERVEILDVELNMALQELPDKREMDLLLSTISGKARDSGLEVRTFRPGVEKRFDFYAAVPVEVEVIGTYHQIATFFDEVGQMERIVNLENVELINPLSPVAKKDRKKKSFAQELVKNEHFNLRATFTGTAFRFLDEGERPKLEEETSRKRRRKKSKRKL